MSLPPLPREFDHHVLGDLEHIVSPSPLPWYPLAPGWLILAGILLALVLFRAVLRLRRWGRNRYRREAVRMLHSLGSGEGGPHTVASINRVLKLAALAAWPKELVASLSGKSWTDFLCTHCSPCPFDTRQLSLLAVATYSDRPPAPEELQGLTVAASLWIINHLGPDDA